MSKPSVNEHIDRGEELVSLLSFTLVEPKPRHAHCRAQLPGFCLLRLRPESACSKYACAFAGSAVNDSGAISPAVRWTSASHNPSRLVLYRFDHLANAARGVMESG